jgi:hypothetical protein
MFMSVVVSMFMSSTVTVEIVSPIVAAEVVPPEVMPAEIVLAKITVPEPAITVAEVSSTEFVTTVEAVMIEIPPDCFPAIEVPIVVAIVRP